MPLTRFPSDGGLDRGSREEDDVQMRSPRASAVIVALSTFVAVVTVAALVSQIAPLDRAGAVLPDGPIVTTGQPVDPAPLDQSATPDADDGADTSADSAVPGPDSADAGSQSSPDGATVVVPAPAEPVATEPEPGPPTNPGNSGSAPGLSGTPGNSGNTPGQSKP